MTCEHCVGAVTRELSALDSVSEVRVDLATSAVTVTSVRPLDDAAIAGAIDEAGYELVG
jgi:copper chaperone CopZ